MSDVTRILSQIDQGGPRWHTHGVGAVSLVKSHSRSRESIDMRRFGNRISIAVWDIELAPKNARPCGQSVQRTSRIASGDGFTCVARHHRRHDADRGVAGNDADRAIYKN